MHMRFYQISPSINSISMGCLHLRVNKKSWDNYKLILRKFEKQLCNLKSFKSNDLSKLIE
ncbi:hypothetical protein BpHYR1_049148 [Brachionus plicatilis]|uniref:Uncharacterized protein n=1 Tax=Brachionus plicatilis TaxID=10195 RepID=A0A3M7SKD4_BRAPC|nr:hypothetical protein BpHYR1_049148 [Brachionus plicatilis]